MKKIKENKYAQIGIMAFVVIACSMIFYFLLFRINDILNLLKVIISLFAPFIIGFVVAYLLNPIVQYLNNHLIGKFFTINKTDDLSKKKITNTISITITVLITLGLIILLFSFILPELLKSIETIAGNLPVYFEEIKNYLLNKVNDNKNLSKIVLNNYDAINKYLNNMVNTTLIPKVEEWLVTLSNGVFGAVKIIFNIVMGFVIGIYYLSDKENFVTGIKKGLYSIFKVKTANRILENSRHTNNIFGNFLIGKLLDALTIGFITFLFLTIFGYPYALLIGVIIGLTNMIPYFGPYIGTIPSALLILMDSPAKCLIFVLFIIVLQQIDSYLIEPKLCGSRTGLKSFWVLASILFFGDVFGLLGLLLGVPVFALIYGYLNNKCLNKLTEKGLPTNDEAYSNLERINSETNKVVKKK